MTNKKLWILVGVLGMVLVVWGGLYVGDKYLGSNESESLGVEWKKINEGVTEILIVDGESEIRLRKDASEWRVNDWKADQSAVGSIIADLSSAETGSMVSENKDKHQNYGLEVERSVRVELKWSDGRSEVLWLGDNNPMGGVYMKRDGDSRVYQVEGLDRYDLVKAENGWRDKTIAAINGEGISQIAYINGGRTIIVEKEDDGKWQISEKLRKEEMEEQKALRLINSFAPLEGVDFLDEEELTELKTGSDYRIEILSNESEALSILALKRPDGSWWMAEREGETGYVVSSVVAEDVVVKPLEGW